MSLARACLRLSAVAALRGFTLAETRVCDSRIGAIDGLKPDERKPVIAVYTEDQAGEALSTQNGGPPFKPSVDLVFEISVVEAQFDDQDVITDIVFPTTDGELEATLDTLEQQIRTILFEDVTKPLSNLFRRAFLRAHHYQSLRFREEAKGIRLAYRYVIVKLEVADEPVLVAYDSRLSGLDLLPKTFREIAHAWPDELPEKAIAVAMAKAFQQPDVPRGIMMTAQQKLGPSVEISATPAGGNVGNGTLTLGSVDRDIQPGPYLVKFVSPTAFVVYGPGLRWKLPGALGEPFEERVSFTITAGTAAFAAADSFTITVAATSITSQVVMPSTSHHPSNDATGIP